LRDGVQAFIGSQSLRESELDERRELGIIFRDQAVIARLLKTFEHDWDQVVAETHNHSKEAVPAWKAAKKVAKGLTKDLTPVVPVLEEVLKEVIGEEADIELNAREVAQTVKDAVKDAVREVVKEAVEEAVTPK